MASTACLKRKQPCGQGAIMGPASGSYGPPGGDRRKRRKDKFTWVKHTLTPYFDGHLWRKYGQKIIKDSPFPRLYFRCSYRDDKNCMASKQVQQENCSDPPLFMVTYEHEHTCGAVPLPASDVDDFVDDDEPPAASDGWLLRFGSSGGSRCRDAWMQHERPQHHLQPVPPSPFLMMNFDSYSSSCQLRDRNPVFLADIPPAAAASWPSPSSFSIVDDASAPPPSSTDDEGGMFSAWGWDSSRYCLDDHLEFRDNSSCSLFSWEVDGCSLGHALMGSI
ncbi:hypothetical protein ACP4OV_024456 [Aristida adscensionis]